jgi:hypothetical protein
MQPNQKPWHCIGVCAEPNNSNQMPHQELDVRFLRGLFSPPYRRNAYRRDLHSSNCYKNCKPLHTITLQMGHAIRHSCGTQKCCISAITPFFVLYKYQVFKFSLSSSIMWDPRSTPGLPLSVFRSAHLGLRDQGLKAAVQQVHHHHHYLGESRTFELLRTVFSHTIGSSWYLP